MLKHILPALAVVALSASSVRAQAPLPMADQAPAVPGVSMVIRDGKVTIKAQQATLRQILAEWERQGQVKVVGAEKLAGGPVTLTLIDIPEKQALEIVMRGVPGYMAIDRVAQADASAGPSRYDRVVVMARAATPVPAAAVASTAPRGMPSPAQPPTGFQQTVQEAVPLPFAPPVGDEGIVSAGPERNDVEQFQQVEPPMPDSPVASPYPNAYPGSPYIGASISSGPYGGNAAAAAAAAAGTTAAPPETQFDYANPQKYFEQRRLQQQGQQPTSVPTAVPSMGTPIGSTGRTPGAQPSAVPTAPGVLPQPGVSPVPQATTPPAQGEFFNPYNLPADWVPPPAVPDNTGTPVEPDRAKYANPYNPSPPPPQ